MTTEQIAHRLVECCRKGEWDLPYKEFYADDAVSIEAYATPMFEKVTKGVDNILEKAARFDSQVEKVYEIKISDPLYAGNSIAFTIFMDVEMKQGGRMPMNELALYQVKDGKVISEEFFYTME